MEDEPEYTLFVAPAVSVYSIPARGPTGHASGQWRTDAKMFGGRLRAVALSGPPGAPRGAELRLEEPGTGELFAVCPLAAGEPVSAAVEQALDSSRNFVLRLVDAASGRRAFVGLGFDDRSTAFDFNVALTDFEKHERRASGAGGGGGSGSGGGGGGDAAAADAALFAPVGDLGLKAGENITVNLGGGGGGEAGKPAGVRPAGGGGLLARLGGAGGGGSGVAGLAPPPGGGVPAASVPPPPPPAAPPAEEGWATFE